MELFLVSDDYRPVVADRLWRRQEGIPLVLDGSSEHCDSEYAINARSGKEVWRFQGPTPGDYDMAAGATISAPGTNGFADGVAYVPSKYGTLYALNLTTGAKLWSHVFNCATGGDCDRDRAIDSRALTGPIWCSGTSGE